MDNIKDEKNITNKYSILLISLLLFTINFILKIIYLDSRDIANDEPFTIFWAQASLKEIIQKLNTGNNSPFHFFLMHFWIKFFGIGPFSVRFPSLFFSAITPVIVFLIGKRFYNKFTGITASLIFTFSTMHIFFSHEARVYSLFALLSAISLYLFLLIIEKPNKKRFYFFLFFTNVILIYSHYFGFFILFIEIISSLATKQRRKITKQIFILMICLALSYIPVIFIFFERFSLSINNGTWISTPELGQFYGFLNLFINDRINMLVLVLIMCCGIVMLIVKKQFKSTFYNLFHEKNIIIFLWFIIPYLIMFIISFKLPMFIDRYILFTSIPFFLVIAFLINHFFLKTLYKLIVAVIFIISLLYTIKLNPDNFRRMKDLISLTNELKTSNSFVLLCPDYADLGFTYHYNLKYFQDYKNYKQHLQAVNIFTVNSENQAKNILDNVNNDCIYIQAGSEFQDSENSIYNYISSKYSKVEHYEVFQIYLVHKFYN